MVEILDLFIKNGSVVLGDKIEKLNIGVTNNKITLITSSSNYSAKKIINANHLHVLPGVIDSQVHFREPGSEYKEDLHTGSKAAAAGGITSFLDMPNNNPAVINAERMAAKKQRAAEQCVVNYGFFVGATPENLAEINSVPNVCGIKVFMGSSTGDLLVHREEDLERILPMVVA